MLALRISAALTCLVAAGFGAPTPYAATHLLRHGKLPTFLGMFPMYGGGFFTRTSHPVFVILLALFAMVCTADCFAGWLAWNGLRVGAWLMIALVPLEAVFWIGFALPIPPILAVVRFALLIAGWASLR